MKSLDIEGVAKAFYVGFLLILWAVLDRIGINDMRLIGTIWALIATIMGWHAIGKYTGANSTTSQALQQAISALGSSQAKQPPASS